MTNKRLKVVRAEGAIANLTPRRISKVIPGVSTDCMGKLYNNLYMKPEDDLAVLYGFVANQTGSTNNKMRPCFVLEAAKVSTFEGCDVWIFRTVVLMGTIPLVRFRISTNQNQWNRRRNIVRYQPHRLFSAGSRFLERRQSTRNNATEYFAVCCFVNFGWYAADGDLTILARKKITLNQ